MSIPTPTQGATMKVLPYGIDRSHCTLDVYGSGCFAVGLPDGREIIAQAESIEETGGTLRLIATDGRPLMILPPGSWVHAYAASAFDTSPVAVRWLAEPERAS